MSAEDGDHLIGQDADLGGLPLLQVGNHQVQGGESGLVGIPYEVVADAEDEAGIALWIEE